MTSIQRESFVPHDQRLIELVQGGQQEYKTASFYIMVCKEQRYKLVRKSAVMQHAKILSVWNCTVSKMNDCHFNQADNIPDRAHHRSIQDEGVG